MLNSVIHFAFDLRNMCPFVILTRGGFDLVVLSKLIVSQEWLIPFVRGKYHWDDLIRHVPVERDASLFSSWRMFFLFYTSFQEKQAESLSLCTYHLRRMLQRTERAVFILFPFMNAKKMWIFGYSYCIFKRWGIIILPPCLILFKKVTLCPIELLSCGSTGQCSPNSSLSHFGSYF